MPKALLCKLKAIPRTFSQIAYMETQKHTLKKIFLTKNRSGISGPNLLINYFISKNYMKLSDSVMDNFGFLPPYNSQTSRRDEVCLTVRKR